MHISPLNEIDWDGIWQEQMDLTSFKGEGVRFWNGMTRRINRYCASDAYAQEIIRRMQLAPDFSVLDVGCGPGTLALPLACEVREVTALDISSTMLERLEYNAASAGVSGIKTLCADFLQTEDDKLGQHDIVIASRSLPMGDLRRSLMKMDRLARHSCYLTWIVGARETDARICEVLGREYHPYPDYLIIANILLTMGIYASIEIIRVSERHRYENLDEAAGHLLRDDGISDGEREKVKKLLNEILLFQDDCYINDAVTRWALIWWKKQ
jgi:ubiquinone/menaquinone biosynthesis C-methylase UbiE